MPQVHRGRVHSAVQEGAVMLLVFALGLLFGGLIAGCVLGIILLTRKEPGDGR